MSTALLCAWARPYGSTGWTSLSIGRSVSELESKARAIVTSDRWREFNGDATEVRITKGARQYEVARFAVVGKGNP